MTEALLLTIKSDKIFEFEFEFDTIIHNNKKIICIMHQEYLYGLCSPSSSTPATEKKLEIIVYLN